MQKAEKNAGDTAELAGASSDLEYSHFLNPKDPTTCFYLGAVRRLQGRPADAIPYMQDAIRYSLDRIPDANYGLALSYLETGRTREGRAVLESLVIKAPGQTPAAGLLARLKAGGLPRTAKFRGR
jgi:tetratricopeptide (TPR) repeat protein